MENAGFSNFDFNKEKSKLSESKSSIKNPFKGFEESAKSQKSKPNDNKQMLDWQKFGEGFNDQNNNVKFEQSKYEPSEPRESQTQIQLPKEKEHVIDQDNQWWAQKSEK